MSSCSSSSVSTSCVFEPITKQSAWPGTIWKHSRISGVTEPLWNPTIDAASIEWTVRQILGPAPCAVTEMTEGAFNRLYRIEHDSHAYVLRLSMPIEMPYKIQSEVATMRWVADQTTIPVPKIRGYATDDHNRLGCPWILMDFVAGHTMHDRWQHLSEPQKLALVKNLAACHAELLVRPFDAIGALYEHRDDEGKPIVRPGRYLPQQTYFLRQGLLRGPYEHEHQLYMHRLNVALEDYETDEWTEPGYLDYLQELKRVAESAFIARKTETRDEIGSRRYPLRMHDLHAQNVLVDDEGRLLAIIDWEFCSTAPIWQAGPPKICEEIDYVPLEYKPWGDYNEDWPQQLLAYEMTETYLDGYGEELASLHPAWVAERQSHMLERELEEEMERAATGFGANSESWHLLKEIGEAQRREGEGEM